MFEGVVIQVLEGYLGRFVKGIQKDQLKIGIWNGEILLEKVELIHEAFDYLQLPFALKHGTVGKLSIKIPWTKFGRDPIIVVLENVFICLSEREESDWSSDAVERRELAWKMAKLNAIELAKFSRRVSDSRAGQPFLSYISAKILENIQVFIRDVHIIYQDTHNNQETFVFGLKLSSLTVTADSWNHNLMGNSTGRTRVGQVKKKVEISSLGFYCISSEEKQSPLNTETTIAMQSSISVPETNGYIISPFGVSVSLSVNRSEDLDVAPQYDIIAELTNLKISLDENQLRQILSLWDYFNICALRKKYGRYRPPQTYMSCKPYGWQKMWWHYAQKCILADVHQKLRRTSWSTFSERMAYRRKYVNLYKRKLDLLQQEQNVSKDILHELEKMDRECDIDDILSFRSLAEQQLQMLSTISTPARESNDSVSSEENDPHGEQPSGTRRGWLNWLPLGMLGAGGTSETSSFAGIVSEGIIQDIYDATEFHPDSAYNDGSSFDNELCLASVKVIIDQTTISICNRRYERMIVEAFSSEVILECRIWENSASVVSSIDSLKIVNPRSENAILTSKETMNHEISTRSRLHFVRIEFTIPQSVDDFEIKAKVELQPFKATFESEFFLNIQQFYHIIASFQFQHNRVISSLNRFESAHIRLMSKMKYSFSSHKKIHWDVSLGCSTFTLPLGNEKLDVINLVFEVEAISLKSKSAKECSLISTASVDSDIYLLCFDYENLYNYLKIELFGFKIGMVQLNNHSFVPVINKFNTSFDIGLCKLLNEPLLKALQVSCILPSIVLHLSEAIFHSLVKAKSILSELKVQPCGEDVLPWSENMENPNHFRFSIFVNLNSLNLNIHLEEDADDSTVISLFLGKSEIRYAVKEDMEFSLLAKVLKIDSFSFNDRTNVTVLCLDRNGACSHDTNIIKNPGDRCIELQYQASQHGCSDNHQFCLNLSGIDIHIYPRTFNLIQKFLSRLDQSSFRPDSNKHSVVNNDDNDLGNADLGFSTFGFSNFDVTEHSVCSTDFSDKFPFVSIGHSSFLDSHDSSPKLSVAELKSIFAKSSQKGTFIATNRSEIRNPTLIHAEEDTAAKFTDCSIKHIQHHLDFSLYDIKIHFHDSSCILGTITIPTSVSSAKFQGANCWDLVLSSQGIMLSSYLSSPDNHELLWGALSSSIVPIINVRLRRMTRVSLPPVTEISVNMQHIFCILPSEFLALVIGYFSLPEWMSRETENKPNLLYKFEILESTVILPVENKPEYSLLIDLPQLLCSFLPVINLANTCKEIPTECMISSCNASCIVRSINILVRNVSVSLLLLKDDKISHFKIDDYKPESRISIIAQMDADLWIRKPYRRMNASLQFPFTSLVMMRGHICEVIARDDYFTCGIEVSIDVFNQFLSVDEESELYKSDMLQFLHLRRTLNKNDYLDASYQSTVGMKLSFKGLSLAFSCLREKGNRDTVAKAELQLFISALVKNRIPQSLDVIIPFLTVHSLSNLLLVSSTSNSADSSHLSIKFSRPCQEKYELFFAIPFLDIWLHFPDWKLLVDILQSTRELGNSSYSTFPDMQPGSCASDSSLVLFEYFDEEVSWIVKSEDITISIHLPSSLEEPTESLMIEKSHVCYQESSYYPNSGSVGNFSSSFYKYAKVIFQSKSCEFTIARNLVKLQCSVEKLRMMLEASKIQKITSISFIHISKSKVGASLLKIQDLHHISFEVHAESLDVAFSDQIFKFLSSFQFKIPATGSSMVFQHSLAFEVHLRKGSLLLSDGRWSCHGPIFEALMKNVLVQFKQTEDDIELSVVANLLINYNNIDKVMWESFIEPWSFQLNLNRKHVGNALSMLPVTEICLKSTDQLNLNVTEPLIEAIFRVNQMLNDASNHNRLNELEESHGLQGLRTTDDTLSRRYAPYVLLNETSLPLVFHVSRGLLNTDDTCSLPMEKGNIIQPGSSIPIYVEEALDEQQFQRRTAHSSERLIEKKLSAVAHHMISIQFDGTSGPSKPMSMDLVGTRYFQARFSNSIQPTLMKEDGNRSGHNWKDEQYESEQSDGLVVPVVFEVSMQRYSKMIRLYSTVILFNSTSVPLELQFDIPLGVSSKILGPIFPGQELPLPLHLAESGQIRWHPLGSRYLWSEVHSLSNMLSQENRIGFLRSFVCYPTHPISDPFRCCISIQDYSLPSDVATKRCSTFKDSLQRVFKSQNSRKSAVHHVRLVTPLVVKNYLPTHLSLTLDSGGITHSISLSEVDIVFIYSIDSTHEFGVTFTMQGFKPIFSKFPRSDSFAAMAKLNGSNYFYSERLTFYHEASGDPICITLDKSMDAFCGAREICLSVPFLLYNCTGLLLSLSEANQGTTGSVVFIPSCYHETVQGQHEEVKYGLSAISAVSGSFQRNLKVKSLEEDSSISPLSQRFQANALRTSSSVETRSAGDLPPILEKDGNDFSLQENEAKGSAKACMYAPLVHPSTDHLVKLSTSTVQSRSDTSQNLTWSKPFSLVPASGSTNIVIPQSSSGAFLVSAKSIPVAGEMSRRTRLVTFQPRYVICNACQKDLSYKQRRTNQSYNLAIGQHSHLHWSDTTRELLISLRFSEPGWQWSGSFLPDFLGDVQVKMRNYVTGAWSMVRVEVQIADLPSNDQNVIKNSSRHFTTQLIMISDDLTGFMPYRIDNFSMERLRIYQQKCEFFDTTVHPYTFYQYAWDEPCFPHRLIVEVPGERILGTYSLDDVKEYVHIFLPSTYEKPERTLHVSVHSEGAIKVLCVIDSNYHIVKDIKSASPLGAKNKIFTDQKTNSRPDYSEILTINVPFFGISLINSFPQELLFLCARETTIIFTQSLEQQKISISTLALQIDNQLPDTPYEILLSFPNEQRARSNSLKQKDKKSKHQSDINNSFYVDSSTEPVFSFAAAMWKNIDTSIISFEYIHLRMAPMCIELEEQILFSLIDYARVLSTRLSNRSLSRNKELKNLDCSMDGCQSKVRDSECKNDLKEISGLDIIQRKELLPSVYPFGAPWQQIYLLARKQKKIYVELFELAPIVLSLSFSSSPWMRRNDIRTEVEPVAHIYSTIFQRGLIALADIEGVPVHLKLLTLGHLMASLESIQDILIKHYTRQLLHEMYKVFGSAGVIGNPIGFARNVGLGIKDFLSVSGKGVLQSPQGLLTGVAQGSRSLFSSTVYAVSSATSQFSKAAHKGIVAFTYDDQTIIELENHQSYLGSHGKGVLDEFLEGLTGLLQSPIRGAERHGLPGVLSGIAIGTAGLVARPMASVLEATGKTAQSIKNWSSPNKSSRFRIRFPRPLARDLPLMPYSWDEAIGISVLSQADNGRLKDEIFVICKVLKEAGKFVIITEKLVLVSWCSCLVGLGTREFAGVPPDPRWIIEAEMGLDTVVHVDRTEETVNIVGSYAEAKPKSKKRCTKNRFRCHQASMPLSHMSFELPNKEEAEDTLQILLSVVEEAKTRTSKVHILHRNDLR